MGFSVASWNINSVRLRIDAVVAFLQENDIDILCLQETKCDDSCFPLAAFQAIGYEHLAIKGQKSYNGVAIISRLPFLRSETRLFCERDDCRHISIELAIQGKNILVHNLYVPAGGDDPDAQANAKFKHKLEFLTQMQELKSVSTANISSILVGDLNVAPLECDVWSHKQLLKVVSHTPQETELLNKAMQNGAWVDLVRQIVKPPEKIYSWWSYRAKDWRTSNRGRRLDHIWAAQDLSKSLSSIAIAKDLRDIDKPSDHVPIIARFS